MTRPLTGLPIPATGLWLMPPMTHGEDLARGLLFCTCEYVFEVAMRSTIPMISILGVLCSCSVVSPPPMRMIHESVLRTDPGGASVALVGGYGGGIFVDDSAGGEGRVGVQVSKEIDLDVSAGAGVRVADNHDDSLGVPDILGWARLGGRYRPDHLDWVSLRFGVGGGGADTGLAYLTTDVGATFGYTFHRRVRPYGGLSVALSAPVNRGPLIVENPDDDQGVKRRPWTTFWVGGNVGLTVRIVANLELGAEGFLDLGWSANAESGSIFGGTGVVRYTFGPIR